MLYQACIITSHKWKRIHHAVLQGYVTSPMNITMQATYHAHLLFIIHFINDYIWLVANSISTPLWYTLMPLLSDF